MHDCDRLVAHPLDSRKAGPGVDCNRLDADRALPACEAAIRNYPDVVRFRFQYATALNKAGVYDKAAGVYQGAAKQGHAIAQYSLGGMYIEGQGVPAGRCRGGEVIPDGSRARS